MIYLGNAFERLSYEIMFDLRHLDWFSGTCIHWNLIFPTARLFNISFVWPRAYWRVVVAEGGRVGVFSREIQFLGKFQSLFLTILSVTFILIFYWFLEALEINLCNEGYFFLIILKCKYIYTAWKVSVFGVALVRIFPHSDWISSNTETFYAVIVTCLIRVIPNSFFGGLNRG